VHKVHHLKEHKDHWGHKVHRGLHLKERKVHRVVKGHKVHKGLHLRV